jgi:hypothetical protein
MNTPCACLLMALAFVGADAEAHPPGATGPQSDVPSPLPCDSDRQIAPLPCVIEGPNEPHVDGAESMRDCIVRCTMDDASIDGMSRQVIDWYAVPPFEPYYAPQIPAEWWWRRSHWQTWRPR